MTQTIRSVQGYLGGASTTDYYEIDLLSTQSLVFDLHSDGGQMNETLLDASGGYLSNSYTSTTNQISGNGEISGTFAAGKYFIEVQNNSNSAPYQLNILGGLTSVGTSNVDNGGNTLAAATSLGALSATPVVETDYISATGDPTDYFSFTISSISRLNVTLSGLTSNTNVYLLGATGNQIASASGQTRIAFSDILPTLPAGTYYLEVSTPSYSNVSTGYNLSLNAVAVPNSAGTTMANALSVGVLSQTASVFSDSINDYNPNDWYSFSVGAESTVSLVLVGLSQSVQATITDAAGHAINSALATLASDGSILTTLAPLASGTYFVDVSEYSSASPYTLSLSATPSRPAGLPTVLVPTATPASVTNYTGSADGGQSYTIHLASASYVQLALVAGSSTVPSSVSFSLKNSTGTVLSSGYANGSGDALTGVNLAAGDYTYAVTSSVNAGSPFTLTYSNLPPAIGTAATDNAGNSTGTARSITLTPGGTSLVDWIGATDTADYYTFTLAAPTAVRFDLTGQTAYVDMALRDASNTNIVSSPVRTGSGGASIVQELAAGTYFLDISDEQPNSSTYDTGYNLTASGVVLTDTAGNSLAAAPNLGTLGPAGQTVSDFVGQVDPHDYYKFSVTSTVTLKALLSGLSNASTVTLLDASGSQISSASGDVTGNASLNRIIIAGTYFLEVSGTSPTTYTLSTAATPLPDITGSTLGTATLLLDGGGNGATVTGAGGLTVTANLPSAALAGQVQALFNPISAGVANGSVVAAAPVGGFLPAVPAGKTGLAELDTGAFIGLPANYGTALDLASGPSSVIAATGGNHLVVQGGTGDLLYAGVSGADTVYAGSGNDLLFGNAATLNVYGGSGSATVVGGTSGNTVTGGSGPILFFGTSNSTFIGGSGQATVIGGFGGITATTGSTGGTVFGSPGGNNHIAASSGNATLVGAGAGDTVTGAGSVGNLLVAGAGAETLDGSKATAGQTIFGGVGPDQIIGSPSNDLIIAESGNATITGGGGHDHYAFIATPGSTRSITINDFNPNLDDFVIYGYGNVQTVGANAIASTTTVNGNSSFSLSDGTRITLIGAPTLTHYNFNNF